MLRRYFSLFNVPALLSVLAIFYILVLTSDNINGVLENIGGMAFMTIVALLWNSNASENWKYVKTGKWVDLTDSVLTKEERVLKQARLGKINPLFVVVNNEYYYCTNNYASKNVLDMTDTIEILKEIKEKVNG